MVGMGNEGGVSWEENRRCGGRCTGLSPYCELTRVTADDVQETLDGADKDKNIR